MDDVWDIPPPTPEQDFADRMAHYERMRAKVRELRGYYNDAMRYRFLRALGDQLVIGARYYTDPEELDREVDAAIEQYR